VTREDGAAGGGMWGRRLQVCLVDTKDLVEEQRAAGGEGGGDQAAAGGMELLATRIFKAIGEFA